ncbi:hypothetical protein AMYX_24660 [Anaeromyxobacter diazotrophicus]|uniref:Uncharacterized protein n=1 Tax=Anaeromyxobacter diazotrophicus TaxID=2590199 RepID=A0A7I9VMU2_9BACT|nr:hypothetical protein AMYX_24660 [Anaeromyxobacter diazotrophicus]
MVVATAPCARSPRWRSPPSARERRELGEKTAPALERPEPSRPPVLARIHRRPAARSRAATPRRTPQTDLSSQATELADLIALLQLDSATASVGRGATGAGRQEPGRIQRGWHGSVTVLPRPVN